MTDQKLKFIRTLGLVIAIVSGFIIFGNSMGALAWSVIDMGEDLTEFNNDNIDPLTFLFYHYLEMVIIMVLFGFFYLLGGLYLRKYKLWARKLVSGLSVVLILIIWGIMMSIFISIRQQEDLGISSYFTIVVALFWSIPLGVVIWYLNKKNIKKHFV